MSEENQTQANLDVFPEKIFSKPPEFKTTPPVEFPDNLIPKDDRVHITDFLHILLSSIKDMEARPLLSCEKAFPPLLRRKAFTREAIRRIKKKSEGISTNKEEYIQEIKKRISLIPDFSQKYDYLLDKS